MQFLANSTEPLILGIDKRNRSGWVAEFGVYFGRSLQLMAQRIHTPLYGFDSFEGLPEDWKAGEAAGSYSTHGKLPDMPANVELHVGWFKDTVPAFIAEQTTPASLLHIDCDLYSSTTEVLEAAHTSLVPGTILVFDDYLGFPGYQEHEMKAFNDYFRKYSRRYQMLGVALLSREVVLQIIE